MGRSRMDLVKEAEDKAASGMAALGLNPDGSAPEDSQTAQEGAQPPAAQAEAQAQDPPQVDNPAMPQAGAQQDKADDDFDIPEGADLRQLLLQEKKNYTNLRSYADRTSGEKAALAKTVGELQRQVQILLMAMPAAEDKPVQASRQAPAQPGGGDKTGEGAQAQISDQADKLIEVRKQLDALAVEYPEIVGPLTQYVDAIAETRIAPVEQLVKRVGPVVDTMVEDARKQAENQAAEARNAYNKQVADKVPGWESLVWENPSVPDGQRKVNQHLYAWLEQHEMGYDYFNLLFPPDGQPGATPAMAAKILLEFQQAQAAADPDKRQMDQRRGAVQGDLQGAPRSRGFVPDTAVPANPIDKLKAGQAITRAELQDIIRSCRADARKFQECWPLVEKAQAERRIIDPGIHPATYYQT
jgi:hypothetical protein